MESHGSKTACLLGPQAVSYNEENSAGNAGMKFDTKTISVNLS